ncbi:MAG TPA: hypothetical protein VM238_08585 [Phycisphaerae bacterium]|nr:hypothetical protein [Phycisphaerae bacterium]
MSQVRARLALALASARPRSPEALWEFVRSAYGLAVPRRAVCPGHAAPMEYLVRAILHPGRDVVVWASRGGAKTELGSVAAHLDSILRPGCQTRILGGSLDQSERMYEYLLHKWDGPFAGLLARDPTARRTELVNGSGVEVLTQSPRSVRGQRVHRLKCDEVDEFSPEVWQAAQFVTQSGYGRDGEWIAAQMEVFSTMHRPFGPMARLVDRLSPGDTPRGVTGPERKQGGRSLTVAASNDTVAASNDDGASHSAPALLVWCLWEVIEPCPPERSCSQCPLWPDCEGRAREAEGYFPIDDAIAQKARSSREAWEAEMLCLRPRADRLVFAEFEAARHVAPVAYNPSLPLYRTLDFGYANPFVCLWVQVEGDCGLARESPGALQPAASVSERPPPHADVDLSRVRLRVVGEYVVRERAIADHAREIAARDPGPVFATFGDPAGWQRSDVTGTGACQELAHLGIRVRTPRAGILEGVELVRRLLKPRPGGEGGLVIDPSCRWLARAFQEYHWDESADGRRSERPAKDGADHPIDALRYLVTGLFLRRGTLRERRW